MSLTRSQLLETAAPDVTLVDDVPGYGTVYLRSYPEGLRMLRLSTIGKDKETWRALRIIDLVVDAEGEPLFTIDDLEAVKRLDSLKLDPLCHAIQVHLDESQKKSKHD